MLSVDQLKLEVLRAVGTDILQSSIERGELSITVMRTRIDAVLRILRDDPAIVMSQLMDICGADYPERPERFDVIYHLLSLTQNARIRVRIHADELTPVPTAVDIYKVAGWFEREAWDLFGITFAGNPDLRRILTDYGFQGHPLRKDFPLTGYVEVRYSEAEKRVVYEPVELPQDFRNFDFLSPWEGMTTVQLPGDEKVLPPTAPTSPAVLTPPVTVIAKDVAT